MTFSKTLFIISTISFFYFADRVLALSREAIVGGIAVSPFEFTYHALIDATKNCSLVYSRIGSGAIVSNKHIISAASLFLLPNGELGEWRFSVVVGTNDLSLEDVHRIDIDRIYFPDYDETFLYFNLAVAKLEDDVNLGRTFPLTKLRLPTHEESFANLYAVVSGFGFVEVERTLDQTSGNTIVTDGTLSTLLRFRNVSILSDDDCASTYPNEITVNNMCGKMQKHNNTEDIVGLCYGDVGNPLVIDDVLVGVASIVTPDCDNTKVGAVYVKVSSFVYNIENFLENVIPAESFYRINRVYVPPDFPEYCNLSTDY